jgi:DNA-binding LacI/PurR family transcriptional regulator
MKGSVRRGHVADTIMNTRLDGYMEGMTAKGIPVRPGYVLTGIDFPETNEGASKAAAVIASMDEKPTL